ncbi:hypothetical protein FACS1894110_21080 [Spirochaetia bacterium]|nr:hypothetical protein FACS1894110_21080 [Spirochaetia bacterium]
MKRIIAGIVMVLVAGFCWGQQRLVVPPFQNRNSGIDVAQMETLTDLFINAIQRTNRFEVPDRDALAMLMQEHKFQMSDWSDDTKTVEMGRVLNANYIVRGIVSKIDTNVYLLIARLLDVNTAQILDSDELEFTTVRDARGKMDSFAQACLNNIRTVRETAQQQQRTQEQQVQRELEQAEQERVAWKNKRWYLGAFLGGGSSTDIYDDYGIDTFTYESSLFLVGGQAQLQVGKYFAIEVDIGYIAKEIPDFPILFSVIPELTFQPGPIEINIGIGYTAVAGFNAEGSLGFHLGPGIIFAEYMFTMEFGWNSGRDIVTNHAGVVGYKIGLKDRK